MKKHVSMFLIIAVICMSGLTACKGDSDFSSQKLNFTVPAGSSKIIFSDEELKFNNDDITISADYTVDGIELVSVWFKDTGIEHAYEGNPYSNTVITPNSSVDFEIDSTKTYNVGIKLINNSENDIPVVITIND